MTELSFKSPFFVTRKPYASNSIKPMFRRSVSALFETASSIFTPVFSINLRRSNPSVNRKPINKSSSIWVFLGNLSIFRVAWPCFSTALSQFSGLEICSGRVETPVYRNTPMGPGAYTQITLSLPICEIMTGLLSWFGVVRDFIRRKSPHSDIDP